MIEMMIIYCPSHAKILDGCHGTKWVVASKPCEHGCWCAEGGLSVSQL